MYINYKYNNQNETVDEAETFKEAKELLKEYQMLQGEYWISKKACKNWYI
tara:strand:+ start:1244 stop:1393 length:150 start_codon:yes stop_codon:yes gene_type:complete